jgi:hypothetical protein
MKGDEFAGQYKWLFEKIRAEVPDCELVDRVWDHGHGYDICATRNGARLGVHLEMDLPDSHYSLNNAPDKEAETARIVEAISNLQGGAGENE